MSWRKSFGSQSEGGPGHEFVPLGRSVRTDRKSIAPFMAFAFFSFDIATYGKAPDKIKTFTLAKRGGLWEHLVKHLSEIVQLKVGPEEGVFPYAKNPRPRIFGEILLNDGARPLDVRVLRLLKTDPFGSLIFRLGHHAHD